MARAMGKNTAGTMLSEAHFLRQVCEVARLGQWMVYHTLRSTGSTAGYPDLCLVRGPDLLYAELKTDVGTVTPAQAAWLAALGAVTHVEAAVWRPTDWAAIERRLLQVVESSKREVFLK